MRVYAPVINSVMLSLFFRPSVSMIPRDLKTKNYFSNRKCVIWKEIIIIMRLTCLVSTLSRNYSMKCLHV